ncbi:MAG: CBS domain-containing protein [Planctomycetota bacterium]
MAKGQAAWSVPPQTTVLEALKMMAEKDIGVLLVVEGDGLAGIFSERDHAREVGRSGSVPEDATVAQLMTKNVLYVEPASTIEECMALMTEKRVRHLPVLERGRVVGIVTIGDVVKKIIADQKFDIQQLEKYIVEGY